MRLIAGLLVVFIMASAGRAVAWDNVPDTEELIDDLRNGDAAKRALAARMVERRGLRAFAALPELVKALRDPDEQVRVWAGLAIAAFGPKARSAVPALIDALDHPRVTIDKRDASEALIRIGTAALPALLKAMKEDKRVPVRGGAIMILGHFPEDAELFLADLLRASREDNAFIRRAAAMAFARVGKGNREVVDALARLAHDEHPPTAEMACIALSWHGPAAAAAMPALRDALKKRADPQLRRTMFHALGRIGAKDPDTVKFLRKALLDSEYQFNCGSVAEALADLGPAAVSAVPELIAALKDKRLGPSISYSAIYALAQIGPDAAKQAMPVLMDMLRSPNQQTADDAVNLLRFMGEAAAPAVPILIQELPRPHSQRRSNAIVALSKTGWPAAEALLKIAEEKNAATSQLALQILARMELSGKKSLPVLLRLVQSDDVSLRSGAARALGALGHDAAEAIPHLVRNLDNTTDGRYGRFEIEALGKIGGNDPRVLRALLANVKGKGLAPRRAAAAWALGNLGAAAKDAVPTLVQLLESEKIDGTHVRITLDSYNEPPDVARLRFERFSTDLRACSLIALAKIGPAAREALPALSDLCVRASAPDFERWVAAAALARIGPPREAVNVFMELLNDEKCPVPVHFAAIEGLAAFGPQAKNAIPLLQKARTERVPLIRQAAAKALQTLTTASKER